MGVEQTSPGGVGAEVLLRQPIQESTAPLDTFFNVCHETEKRSPLPVAKLGLVRHAYLASMQSPTTAWVTQTTADSETESFHDPKLRTPARLSTYEMGSRCALWPRSLTPLLDTNAHGYDNKEVEFVELEPGNCW